MISAVARRAVARLPPHSAHRPSPAKPLHIAVDSSVRRMYVGLMSEAHEIIASLRAVGITVHEYGSQAAQGSLISVAGHTRMLRLYSWRVTDNGGATGEARSWNERRIQAIGSKTQRIEVAADAETLILGWCSDFAPHPLIVAFNPFGVASRVNGKVEGKGADGVVGARASDSQQFRQSLLDEATSTGLALWRNQHGEYVVAMTPLRFVDYLTHYKPAYHAKGAPFEERVSADRPMGELVAEAELDDADPLDTSTSDAPPAFDLSVVEVGRERVARDIVIRRGQAAFRQGLLEVYGCCAMSGSTVEPALEAAHIVPYRGPGTNHVSNGLLLRADFHSLFDFGLLSVDPATLSIIVSPMLTNSEYVGLHGQALNLGFRRATPSPHALAIHRAFARL
jgi:hypothetical protein